MHLCITKKYSSHVKFLFHELIVSHKFSAWWSHNKLISYNPIGAWVTCLFMKLILRPRMENCSCIWGPLNGLIGGLREIFMTLENLRLYWIISPLEVNDSRQSHLNLIVRVYMHMEHYACGCKHEVWNGKSAFISFRWPFSIF